MRLISLTISQYKNLRDFSLSFDGNSFIDVLVGKNGSGKSNLFEALIEIFRHVFEYDNGKGNPGFDFTIKYEIDSKETEIAWKAGKFSIDGKERAMIGKTLLPDNVLIYYSGHNTTVADLVQRYEDGFRKRIQGANLDESRRFIGVGPEYKALLLSVLLTQPENNKARQFVCQKLGIESIGADLRLVLQRPSFATGALKALGADNIENFDPRTHYWGADGITRDFLDMLVTCVKGEFSHGNVFDTGNDRYQIPVNIELFQQRVADQSLSSIFRQFDNLKTLGMLADISIPLTFTSGLNGTIAHFSDGQFQSVYIYSIVELFKDRNCLILLDEPDAFLHPEWQFDFLRQVFDITDTAAKTSHVLMSSHSAVTLIPHDKKKIKFFDIKDNQTNCYELPKAIVIKKLSSNLIKYSEQEQLLSIINAVQIEKKPVLFTEGSTDPIILKEAWYKLYEEDMPFIPFYAFSCTYINQLLTDNRIHGEMGGLPIFALFDFDKAYDQWNGLNGNVTASDPFKGLIKKWAHGESYAVMLPVPAHADIQRQVIRNPGTDETFGGDSCCEIEHLFYGQALTADYYHQEPCVGGTKIVFKSDRDKTSFAKDVVPILDKSCFEPFKPIFEFIKSKCNTNSS
ncbi:MULTISPECIES: ATP-binding protein [Aeromonas]|jgi:predicted ATPase|uniref:AAA family ATPase n=2 Tax=Aeromonas caviae TaxID=648 RepID=A0ABU5W6H0_AERCA|nr:MULTISPECIES: ATP-binding protein [Aeromonas]MCV9382635.1 AAA family ATPase [Aeromonas hydrophila]MEA9428868.1 AAA family ATPase [Aeromonas caviae]MEA9436454.1 AAA family ATPase [Aeromonas caviae]